MIGDIIFFRKTDTIISRIIAYLTKSQYTHVGLVVDETQNGIVIIESDRFIKTRERELFTSEQFSVFRLIHKPEEFERNVVAYARNKLGARYDYLQVLGLFVSLFLKKGRLDYFNNKNRMLCSELIDLSYLSSSVARKNYENVGNLSPQELFEYYELMETKGE